MSKHSHYYKDVSHLTEIDVYQVCQLFKVDDPSGAIQHAIKKLLVPGQRGAGKSKIKDIREAIDTLTRLVEIMTQPDVQMLTGIPFTVSRDHTGCGNMDSLIELKSMGATSVCITPEFHKELMSSALYQPRE